MADDEGEDVASLAMEFLTAAANAAAASERDVNGILLRDVVVEDIRVGVEMLDMPLEGPEIVLEPGCDVEDDGEMFEDVDGDRLCGFFDFDVLSNETNDERRADPRSFDERLEDLCESLLSIDDIDEYIRSTMNV